MVHMTWSKFEMYSAPIFNFNYNVEAEAQKLQLNVLIKKSSKIMLFIHFDVAAWARNRSP